MEKAEAEAKALEEAQALEKVKAGLQRKAPRTGAETSGPTPPPVKSNSRGRWEREGRACAFKKHVECNTAATGRPEPHKKAGVFFSALQSSELLLRMGTCSLRGLNPRPMAHRTIALTTELKELGDASTVAQGARWAPGASAPSQGGGARKRRQPWKRRSKTREKQCTEDMRSMVPAAEFAALGKAEVLRSQDPSDKARLAMDWGCDDNEDVIWASLEEGWWVFPIGAKSRHNCGTGEMSTATSP